MISVQINTTKPVNQLLYAFTVTTQPRSSIQLLLSRATRVQNTNRSFLLVNKQVPRTRKDKRVWPNVSPRERSHFQRQFFVCIF